MTVYLVIRNVGFCGDDGMFVTAIYHTRKDAETRVREETARLNRTNRTFTEFEVEEWEVE